PSPPSLSSPIRLPPRPTPFPYTTLFRSGGITPSTHNLTLSVPAFLRATGGAPAATLHVDDLSLFRSGAALSSTTPIQLSSSLPYIPSIRAESANFNFSSQAAYNQLPVVPVSELQLQLISPVTSPSISLSTNRQDRSEERRVGKGRSR